MGDVMTARRDQVLLCAVLVSATFMSGFTYSSISSVIPEIAIHFNVDAGDATWVNSMYLLFSSGLILIFGKICDRGAMKKVLTYGIVAFITGATLCLVFDSYTLILIARAVQGLGGSTFWCASITLGVRYLPKDMLAWAMVSITVGESTGNIVGAPTAGLLLTIFHWKAPFFLDLAFGIMALILALRVVPKDGRLEMSRFDYRGALMLILVMFSGSYGLEVVAYDGFTPLGALLTITFITSLLMFILFSKRAADPIVDLSVFGNGSTNRLIVLYVIKVLVTAGMLYIIPLYAISVLGFTSMEKGFLMFIPPAIACTSSFMIGKTMSRRMERPYIVLIGAILVITSITLMLVDLDPMLMIVAVAIMTGLIWSTGEVAVASVIVNSAPDSRRCRTSIINSYLANLSVAVGSLTFSKLFVIGSGSEGVVITEVAPEAFMNGVFLVAIVCLTLGTIGFILSLMYRGRPTHNLADEV